MSTGNTTCSGGRLMLCSGVRWSFQDHFYDHMREHHPDKDLQCIDQILTAKEAKCARIQYQVSDEIRT